MSNVINDHNSGYEDTENKVQSCNNYQEFYDEATYVLVENNEGTWDLEKKPTDTNLEQVADPWRFVESIKEPVLIIRTSGTFYRFNYTAI